jgi:hypothetical protein
MGALFDRDGHPAGRMPVHVNFALLHGLFRKTSQTGIEDRA